MKQLSEFLRDAELPKRIADIAREYRETGRVSAAKINAILGGQTRAATMPKDRECATFKHFMRYPMKRVAE